MNDLMKINFTESKDAFEFSFESKINEVVNVS